MAMVGDNSDSTSGNSCVMRWLAHIELESSLVGSAWCQGARLAMI